LFGVKFLFWGGIGMATKKAKKVEQITNEGEPREGSGKQKPRRVGRPRVELPAKQAKFLNPGNCRNHLRKALAREFEEITKGFVKAAKAGSVPHVKLATELLKPTRKSPRKQSTAVRILKEWAEAKKKQGIEEKSPDNG
jgi:hypothetical protein